MKKPSDSPRVARLLAVIFLSLGLVMLLVGAACHFITQANLNSRVSTQAVITDLDDSRTTIRYTAGGETMERVLNQYSSGWQVGDSIPVYYNPENPTQVTSSLMTWLLPLIFGINGGMFAIVGAAFCLSCARLTRRRRTLMENGTRVFAAVSGLQVNYNVRLNRRHPVRLQCRYTAPDGTSHVFRSDNIWIPLDEGFIGKRVAVYVDRTNMDRFYVDPDSLEGLGRTSFHGK